jgi:hypothetical protein
MLEQVFVQIQVKEAKVDVGPEESAVGVLQSAVDPSAEYQYPTVYIRKLGRWRAE